jgi:general secretion pathway protein D
MNVMNKKLKIHLYATFVSTIITSCTTDHVFIENSATESTIYTGNAVDPTIRSAIQALMTGNPEHANSILNAVLSNAPRDPLANLLNGMAYQMRAAGEGPYWDMAKVGYQLARKFDPYLWQASYLLGLMLLKERSLDAAAVAFSESALASPQNATPLYALAAASYAQGDLSLAYQAVKQAARFDGNNPTPNNRHISALCAAAVGDFALATTHLTALKAAGTTASEINWLEQKISTWQAFHTNLDSQPFINSPQPIYSDESTPGIAKARMAILDAIILRTSAVDTQSRGVNLLEGLSAQFEGVLINPSRTREEDLLTNTITSDKETLNSSLKLSVPAVTYSMNIANSADASSRMVGNPSVLAVDGKESKFFLGSELTIFTTGDYINTAVKEFGLSIQVTPTFLSDDTVELRVDSGLSTLNSGKPPGIDKNSLSLEKMTNTASAVMRFGQTLVVSAGTIYQESNNQSGVPLLNKVPIVDNLFSHRYSEAIKGTLLILLTLKPAPERNTPTSTVSVEFKQHPAFLRIQQQLEPIAPTIQTQLERLKDRDVLTMIRPTDVTPNNPVYTNEQDVLLRQWRQKFLNEMLTVQ